MELLTEEQIEALKEISSVDIQRTLPGSSSSGAENIKVLVRIRPFSEKEIADKNDFVVDIISDQSLCVTNHDGKKSFQCSFDSVLGPSASQQDVYNVVKECTDSVINGFNSTIFAYGQTGSGKTYSMYGPPVEPGAKAVLRDSNETVGLIPRAIGEIFQQLSNNTNILSYSIYCSFVQIYNENLFDMLRDSSMAAPLAIREEKKEIYVQGLSEYNVKSVADTLQLLRVAEDNRAIRETHMNQFSSRSHSIFLVFVEHKRLAPDGGEISLRAKFNLVDLAGSEKWNTRLYMKDEHIAEMTNINLSLHTLGKCISALAQASNQRQKDLLKMENSSVRSSQNSLSADTLKGSTSKSKQLQSFHIPFRESKLTRLLQDSLGGNSKTFLLATISPAKINCEESISTLKFADRAKQVMVQAILNETRPVDHALVKRLQLEVQTLKTLLKKVLEHHKINSVSVLASNESKSTSDVETFMTPTRNNAYNNALLSPAKPVQHSNAVNNAQKSGESIEEKGFFMTAGSDSVPNNPNSHLVVLSSGPISVSNAAIYIESLEKALNKEQIHAQHLTQKNETLIKELEELRQSAHSKQQLREQLSVPGCVVLSPPECQQVMSAVREAVSRQAELWGRLDSLQKVMKKFFKFQIEEDDMKQQILLLFEGVKELKGSQDSEAIIESLLAKLKESPNMRPHMSLPTIPTSQDSGKHLQSQTSSHQEGSTSLPHIKETRKAAATSQLPHRRHVEGEEAVVTSAQPALAYRLRGGVEGHSSGINNAAAGDLRSSTDSLGGWVGPQEAEQQEEERLRKELKQAKKRQKQQLKMQEWLREKEEKAEREAKQQEEEKRAMQEAEELREQRRKEYARKQKEKLNSYQKNFKSEAGKLQELVDLGIDPELLF